MHFLIPLLLALSLAQAAPHPSGHRHLADRIEDLKPHYKHLVIGSGYGASVAALRLAESGDGNLAVLERGREWMPGDFPENIVTLAAAVRSSVNPLGLIATNTHEGAADMDVVGASALGGTSQLNAAIALRPPANVWTQSEWPEAIRRGFARGELEQDFRRAEEMLRPNHGPHTRQLEKSKAHLAAFPKGFPTGELTLNVNHEPGRVTHGVRQEACTNCGNCVGGCNVGAKNTLTTNYLPRAKDLGAEIFTQIEVRFVEKLAGPGPRYRVHYTYHYKNESGLLESSERTLTADNIFLGAGSAGSTQILMRSQSAEFPFSRQIGTRVSANGDVLGFVYNGKIRTNLASESEPVGQTITVYGDYRELNLNEPLERQFLLLDGAAPKAMVPELSKALGVALGVKSLISPSDLTRVAKDFFRRQPSAKGAFNHSMLLLACGHDSSGGHYQLDSEGNAYVVWPNMQEEESFQYINAQMEAYAERLGGTFIPNPRASLFGGGKMQATHPLGGLPMGESVETGVVNHLGQVFTPDGGLHEGLYVVDASIIPRSLAAPPLITITALAERALRHFTAARRPPCEQVLSE